MCVMNLGSQQLSTDSELALPARLTFSKAAFSLATAYQLISIDKSNIIVGQARPHPQYPQEYKVVPVKGKSCALCDLTRHASCKKREPWHCLIACVIERCPRHTSGPSIPFLKSIDTYKSKWRCTCLHQGSSLGVICMCWWI